MPTPELPARPDAILFPFGRLKGSSYDRTQQVARVFGPVLGTLPLCTKRMLKVPMNFVQADPRVGTRFPKDHDRRGQDRYRWHVAHPDPKTKTYLVDPEPLGSYTARTDAVLFGYKVEGADDLGEPDGDFPTPSDPAELRAVKAKLKAAKAEDDDDEDDAPAVEIDVDESHLPG